MCTYATIPKDTAHDNPKTSLDAWDDMVTILIYNLRFNLFLLLNVITSFSVSKLNFFNLKLTLLPVLRCNQML